MSVIERSVLTEAESPMFTKGQILGGKILRCLFGGPPLEKPRVMPFNTEQQDLAEMHAGFCEALQLPLEGEFELEGFYNRLTRIVQMGVVMQRGRPVAEREFGYTYTIESCVDAEPGAISSVQA